MTSKEIRWGWIITIGGGVAASLIFEATRNWSLGLLTSLWRALSFVWTWLFSSHSVSISGYTIIFFGICALLVVITIGVLGVGMLKSKGLNESTWKEFRRFLFDGMIWIWDYDYYEKISDLHALCPGRDDERCERRLDVDVDFGSFHSNPQVRYRCGRCGWEAKFPFRDHYELERHVSLEIERLVRTGGWKQNLNC